MNEQKPEQVEKNDAGAVGSNVGLGLLPCPFCGGEASRRVSNDILQVGCDSCLITFANHVRFGCRADTEWNMRPNMELTGAEGVRVD